MDDVVVESRVRRWFGAVAAVLGVTVVAFCATVALAHGSYGEKRGEVVAFAALLIILIIAGTVAEHHLRKRRLAARARLEYHRLRGQKDIDRFFSILPDLLCIAGFDGTFKHVNPAWATVLGYDADDLLDRPFASFVHPDDLADTQD